MNLTFGSLKNVSIEGKGFIAMYVECLLDKWSAVERKYNKSNVGEAVRANRLIMLNKHISI